MLSEAQFIVDEFELNYPIPTSVEDWDEEAELIALYLAAKKYIERHG